MSLEAFMRKHFFQPLKLEGTTFTVPEEGSHASSHITLSDGTPFKVPCPDIGDRKLMAG
jgi:CubicO group peptidase (beta-lactamase class C family)